MIGLVPHNELIPGDLIGVNKDSYLILDKLPAGQLKEPHNLDDNQLTR